jgi:AraC-like DNA-binding protein
MNGSGSPALIQRVEQTPAIMHGHNDFIEIVLIVEGSALHRISTGDSYSLGSGDFFYVPKGSEHSYSGIFGLKLINVLVREQFMKEILAELEGIPGSELVIAPEGSFKRPGTLAKEKLASCLDVASRIEMETWEGGAGREQMLKALLTELCLRLFRFALASEGLSQHFWPEFGRLAEYMERHVQKQASIAAMAKAGGVSKRTLLRRFKCQTGMSPMEYLAQLRLSKACRMLRESSLEIKNIAIACGFPDSNYFARQYKKRLGVSPREFRKACTTARQTQRNVLRPAQ